MKGATESFIYHFVVTIIKMDQEANKPNLGRRLFKPVDLIPGVGLLTNVNRISDYNIETARIREGTIKSTENPDSRDSRSTLTVGLMTLYHVLTLGTIGTCFNVGEKIYQLAEKLM